MEGLVAAALKYVSSHLSVLVTGFLGALFGALLSKDPWLDRVTGFLAGFILCIVFAEPASNLLAGGNSPEIFGFLLGAVGKSTAEILLEKFRKTVVKKMDDKLGDSEDE